MFTLWAGKRPSRGQNALNTAVCTALTPLPLLYALRTNFTSATRRSLQRQRCCWLKEATLHQRNIRSGGNTSPQRLAHGVHDWSSHYAGVSSCQRSSCSRHKKHHATSC
ncbi:hypothetical protein TRVL_08441 [Trypanosoma vivax]|nr:hypothetical protein TRVL_08441 [Trypanosoma vivax]